MKGTDQYINKKGRDKTDKRRKISLFFAVVVAAIILIKPVHFLFVDHHYDTINPTTDTQSFTGRALFHPCEICLFTLFYFILFKFEKLTRYLDQIISLICIKKETNIFHAKIGSVSLRAPPAVQSR